VPLPWTAGSSVPLPWTAGSSVPLPWTAGSSVPLPWTAGSSVPLPWTAGSSVPLPWTAGTYQTGYRPSGMSNYAAGAVIWIPAMIGYPTAHYPRTTGATANTEQAQVQARPPQPVLCMVSTGKAAPSRKNPKAPARIAVIANTDQDCAAIGGSVASQTAATR
jgi:hypothetical protein